jgi:NAD(P)-dependent dehydrogenase (short-subunit alcohol dehydrogenase family)
MDRDGRRIALVTGARQGMGSAISRRLASEGMHVVCVDVVDDPRLHSLADEIAGAAYVADCSDPAAVADLFAAVSTDVGDVDVLVANHAYMTMAPVDEHDLDDWWRVVDTNLGGTFLLIQAALPGMRRTGSGRIVVIASEWGVIGWPDASAYSASKAGLISLTKTLGRELAPEQIVINAIAPGVIDTPQLEVDADAAGMALEDMHAVYAESIPMGRIGTPAEIAATVAFLADPAVGSLVGQVVQVNGASTRGRA